MRVDPFPARGAVELDSPALRQQIRRFLEEDLGSGDVTTGRVVPPGAMALGWMIARQPLVVAGLDVVRIVFQELDPALEVEPTLADGTSVQEGTHLVRLRGRAAPILTGERLALNLVQRLSGIATLTRRYVDEVAGTGASVSDTRKTTPGLRLLEKHAVRVGGGRNHRMGLHDAVLIKDNHAATAGGVAAAVRAAKAASPPMPVQVEVDSLAELGGVLSLGLEAVLLDNMTPDLVAAAVRAIRAHPRGRDCWVEASGGITLQNIRAYAEAGVDTISVGALTHSAPSVDIALDLEPSPEPGRSHGHS